MTTIRSRTPVALVLTAGLLLSGCGGSSDEAVDKTPKQVLAAAKTTLDETSGVHVVLSTDTLPPKISGILSADGIGTHDPAFEGTLKVVASGITADADVVAVGGIVYAKLPFTTEFEEIDPADYGAPDPADLMGAEGGLSALLTSVEDVKEGKAERSGETVLSTYSGVVPGEGVSAIIPTADADGDFEAKFTVTEDNVLNEAVITGPFYPKADDVTYTIRFDKYDTSKNIAVP
jgi:lipoprotein LprG